MTKAALLSSVIESKEPTDADLTAIAALVGTTGLLRKTAANTWSLDTSNNTATATVLQTPRNINGVSFNGSSDITVPTIYDTNFRRITNPGGGTYQTGGPVTGALTITFPTLFTSTMIRVTVKVYEYTTNNSFDITFGGYIYYTSGGWVNSFAYINGNPNTNRQLTIRFGKTAAGNPVVYIGELATVWQYPQVFITDIQAGFGGQTIGLTTGWTIGPTTAAFETVSATISNPQIGYQSSANTPNSVVFRDASGNFAANQITVSAGFNSTNIISFLNSGAAQGIKVGSLVIDSTYATNAPTDGLYVKGQLQSGVTTGTAPFTISSTTKVTNLYADRAALADNSTLVGGYAPNAAASNNTVVLRNASGYVFGNYFNMTANVSATVASHIAIQNSSDNYLRWQTPAQFITNHGLAALLSPALTGTPTAPTAAVSNNTTQIATTAFVNAEIANDAAPIAHVGSGGTSHAVATISVAGFMSGADKTKLDDIATGATANTGTVTSVGGTGTVNGLTLTGSVTTSGNLTLGGTLSSIANSALTNSSVTVGTTAISLGTASTTLAGLTSVTSTSFVGALTGNAATATNVAYTGLTGTVPTWNQNTTGNAATATKLQTARTINGVNFDGTANITIADSTKVPLDGTGATGTWGISISGNAATATKLQTARTINGVNFDGTANITISAASAYALTPGSYITGSSYNGSAAVTFAVDATTTATANKVVARDGSGNTAVNELYSTAVKLNSIVTNSTATITTTSVAQTALLSLAVSTYAGTKIVIQATRAGERHITELLVLHNGTVASSTEYGSIITGSSLFTTDVDISGGSMRILVTSSTTASTVYKATYTAITI